MIDTILTDNGYIRRKDMWYFHTDECICFFSFGKNDLGRFDHVMGCFLKELMETNDLYPVYYKNHLKYSLNYFQDENVNKTVFNIEFKMYKGEEREKIIEHLIKDYAVPFLNDVSSKNGIKRAMEKYKNLIYFCPAKLLDKLDIPLPE